MGTGLTGGVLMAEKVGYKEIFETLRKEVLDGKYDDTTVLPSEWALARRFGVCRPTVSRAILEMVRDGLVVRRQGAPTTLTRFAKNASGAIGVVVQGEWNYEDLYPSIVRSLSATMERSGWKMVRCGLQPSSGRRRVRAIREVVERFVDEHVSGVFLQPIECMRDSTRFNEEIVARLEDAGIYVTLLDYDIAPVPARSNCDLVGVDNFAAGYALGRHLRDRGKERVAFSCMPFAAPSVSGRLRGLTAALQDDGLRWWPGDNTMLCNPESAKDVAEFMRSHRPDAIVAYNDKAALALLKTFPLLGLSVPGDVLLAGFDDIPAASTSNPPLTTMAQPVDEMASAAFHTLVSRIKSPQLPPRKTLLHCRLVPRASTDS